MSDLDDKDFEIRALDIQKIMELEATIEQQAATIAMLRDWFKKDNSCDCDICWSCAGKGRLFCRNHQMYGLSSMMPRFAGKHLKKRFLVQTVHLGIRQSIRAQQAYVIANQTRRMK